MNFDRIYEYRFAGIENAKKQQAWREISKFIYKKLGSPDKILDPAAGFCEFINHVPSKEKWVIDLNEPFINKYCDPTINKLIGNNLEIKIPENYFDGIFVSNFLEHLHTQEQVSLFLDRMHKALKPGGKIAIIGPNFKYTYKNYFDFADHTVVLTELGVAEHLYGATFSIEKVHPKFLPLSFRGKLPPIPFLIKLYLRFPLFWSFFGKQFLLIGKK
ncbi:MAG: methyltransferase domain-containing protein [Bacteroidetes bacterium]|nr:methyltransferase domain-containing protein [Bacteroidota bacterium]